MRKFYQDHLHRAIRRLSWTARGFVSDAPPARNGSGKQLSLGEINSVSKERLMYRGDPVSESVCRILIVDDHRDMTDSATILLKMMGHHVLSCYDGFTAIRLAKEFQPDIVCDKAASQEAVRPTDEKDKKQKKQVEKAAQRTANKSTHSTMRGRWDQFQAMVNECDTKSSSAREECLGKARDTFRAANFKCDALVPSGVQTVCNSQSAGTAPRQRLRARR